MADSWVLYPELRDRVITLARSLRPEELDRTVPLTPGWTIAEVIAHVCGLNADVVAGITEDLGSDERTTAQVSSRAGQTIDEVCDEWLRHDTEMAAATATVPLLEQRLAADLVIHLHDIQHALGLPIIPDDVATSSAAHVYAMRMPDRWRGVTGVSVLVELDDGFRSGAADATVTLRSTPYDFLRSVSGRRSRAQVESLDWSELVPEVLDDFSPYAALGAIDAPV